MDAFNAVRLDLLATSGKSSAVQTGLALATRQAPDGFGLWATSSGEAVHTVQTYSMAVAKRGGRENSIEKAVKASIEENL